VTSTHVDLVESYINEVRERLADVPEEDRVELLDDVASHVREIADEFGADELETRLGSPAAFTDELRASAGYASEPDAAAPSPSLLRRSLASLNAAVRTDANRELWRKLEPGWFVVRGLLFGYVLWSATGAHDDLLRLLVLLAAAVVSFKLGERRPATQATWLRRARIGAEVALVVVALAALDSKSDRVVYYDSGGSIERDPCLRDSAGRPIGNLYAFDPSGQLIPQFFLTDQAGRPIDNLCPDQVTIDENGVDTSYARDVNGAPVYGVFPRKQNQAVMSPDGQTMTPKPVAPPAVVFPQLAPPTSAAPAATEETPQP
jgi:hypothetical protein